LNLLELNKIEIGIMISLVSAGIFLFYLYFVKSKIANSSKTNPKSKTSYTKENPSLKKNKQQADVNVLEVFDYNGTKILHESGFWTVNDAGMIQVYKDWALIPPKYQKMVKELDNRSIKDQKQADYFLEILNGFYYVSMPGGRKKKYNTFTDIPEDIRKFLGKS